MKEIDEHLKEINTFLSKKGNQYCRLTDALEIHDKAIVNEILTKLRNDKDYQISVKGEGDFQLVQIRLKNK